MFRRHRRQSVDDKIAYIKTEIGIATSRYEGLKQLNPKHPLVGYLEEKHDKGDNKYCPYTPFDENHNPTEAFYRAYFGVDNQRKLQEKILRGEYKAPKRVMPFSRLAASMWLAWHEYADALEKAVKNHEPAERAQT